MDVAKAASRSDGPHAFRIEHVLHDTVACHCQYQPTHTATSATPAASHVAQPAGRPTEKACTGFPFLRRRVQSSAQCLSPCAIAQAAGSRFTRAGKDAHGRRRWPRLTFPCPRSPGQPGTHLLLLPRRRPGDVQHQRGQPTGGNARLQQGVQPRPAGWPATPGLRWAGPGRPERHRTITPSRCRGRA